MSNLRPHHWLKFIIGFIVTTTALAIAPAQSASHRLGDVDFFGFNSGQIGDDVPFFDFDNQSPSDPAFTDRDLRQSVDGPDSDNDIGWTHDLDEFIGNAVVTGASLNLAIGGIQDGNQCNVIEDRIWIEGFEVMDAWDDLNQGPWGTGNSTFSLSADQLDSLLVDRQLNVFIDGAKLPPTGCSPNELESYFIDHVLANLQLELALTVTSNQVAAGDPLDFAIAGGQANAPAGLLLLEINGVPFVHLVTAGTFDASGTWTLPATVPPGLAGLDLLFEGVGTASAGRAATTNRQRVIFE